MGDIYRGATQRVLWLGDAVSHPGRDKDTARAFHVVKRLAQDAADVRRNPLRKVEYQKGAVFDEFKFDGSVESIFFENPWWRRAWTAQGIVLARRALLVSGRYQVDGDLFRSAMHHSAALGIAPWNHLVFGNYVDPPTTPFWKIYSALGFANGRLSALGIAPDYRKPVRDVYRNAQRRLLEVSGNLDMLGLCFPFTTPGTLWLPSWVPDWGPANRMA
ncbi:hypothetical protein N657DRAFT_671153 [Parathielavia appendiculata]|uniref:Uncharacterized protein n=1 Tax=Parathielavia appendiculata TaxID=2587402 RepID=A0AAN6U0H9_9PEZI|nr:hypothetical protein N657DRAFT_671153 [Parathielavia appendiculata]